MSLQEQTLAIANSEKCKDVDLYFVTILYDFDFLQDTVLLSYGSGLNGLSAMNTCVDGLKEKTSGSLRRGVNSRSRKCPLERKAFAVLTLTPDTSLSSLKTPWECQRTENNL